MLTSLPPTDLRALAAALKSGRLAAPFSAASLRSFVDGASADAIAASLRQLAEQRTAAAMLANTLELLADGIAERPAVEDLIDVVTTGPEGGGMANRTTAVVVADLFRNAQESVLVAGYAVRQGEKIFQALADRMQQCPALQVRFYLDIQRRAGDTTAAEHLVSEFAQRFRTKEWPAEKALPDVYYAPRSLQSDWRQCSALHAKCIVIDVREVFVSSANFTEAAQTRNIELGLLLRSPAVALRVLRFFGELQANGYFQRIL